MNTGGGQAQRPTVSLDQGIYVGKTITDDDLPREVEAFLGIPYATAQRLRQSQLPPASSETVDASEYGPVCPTADPSFPAGEDCLSANVFRPISRGSDGVPKKVPVLVYVHGGAFNFGRGADRNLAAFVSFSKKDVVAVGFNYRLGPLGFLPCGAAAKEGIANLGLLDQRTLLEWVHRNIARFGGDEDDVTVMGFSAGAHSVGHHVLSPPSRKLFRRAVLESGAPTARSVLAATHPRHETQLTQFLASASLSHLPEDQILPALRSLPLPQLLQASLSVWTECAPSVQWPFQPSIDGGAGSKTIIPTMPIRTWTSSDLPTPPPLITGFNTSEGTTFVPASASSPAAFRNFFAALIPACTPQDLETLDSLYPPASTYPAPPTRHHGSEFRRLAHAYGHYGYIAPLLHSAHFASRRGAPVWVYEYAAHADLGAANHGDHVPAATRDADVLSPGGTPGLWAVSEAMHGFWSSFVTSGDEEEGPNGLANSSGITWPRFVSPFGDVAGGAEDYVPTDEEGETRGKIVVFGEGNDELMGRQGRRQPGTVARVRTLTEAEMRQFRFWWDHVGLSEGMGGAEDESKL
ncbi:phenmedipham hydrolase [Colletotrichum karsti]|uniref:Carboxylic ester hydrolase n=1 Tax=Colletotrichum karsti TaxID=1095194 RepID=A0A9P6HT85_9PEZI|nr:phenmedipham hydrolase [Colletotrichum karsti]KAF9870138.1 phenmedipham hydrolase [Colletotrichum karsti]